MEQGVLFTYDGSFHGFLSCVYTARDQGLKAEAIRPAGAGGNSELFQEQMYVPTHMGNAKKIWESLGKHGSESQRYIYFSFLSERTDIQIVILHYIDFLIRENAPLWKGHFEFREKLSPWAQRVGSEKRYLETHMVFDQTASGIQCATVEPVYNVLPLLTRYCRNRFKAEPWALYDARRGYGLRYLNGDLIRFSNAGADTGVSAVRPKTESRSPLRAGHFGRSTRSKNQSLRVSA